jgi:chemotaxis protein methyltransferase CheR
MVHVRQFNLVEFPYTISGPMDIIFCRNVMIYFDRQTRAKIIGEFSRIMRPGGCLFIGHSETLSGMTTDFTCVRPSIYKKG